MRHIALTLVVFTASLYFASGQEQHVSDRNYNIDTDLLLVHYDCKTDVDDLHSVAAFATLLAQPEYQNLKYHAVAGTYGMQNGLYVPANELFDLAFKSNWSDAHNDYQGALASVSKLVLKTLGDKGTVWISEAGQSDFSADLLKVLKVSLPDFDRIQVQIVQHSDWNEKVTTPEKLDFAKNWATYHKIPDGNATQNGTPGFRSEEVVAWSESITDEHLIKVWELAIVLGNQYNGADNRYLNQAIKNGGLDFSDFAEVCWILGLHDIKDASDYFKFIAQKN